MIASTIFIILYCNISVKYTKKSKQINKDMFIHIDIVYIPGNKCDGW